MRLPVAALVTISLVAACSLESVSNIAGLDPDNSNVAVKDFDPATNRAFGSAIIRDLRLLPNTKVPKGFLVSLMKDNEAFVGQLYEIVRGINTREGLSGMNGPNQEITMVVVGEDDNRYATLERTLRAAHGLAVDARVPYLARIRVAADNDPWMQDWGEFAAVRLEGQGDQRVHAVMESGRGIKTSRFESINTLEFSRIFKIPFIRLTPTFATSGNYGGNTEATHEGRLYYGDRMAIDKWMPREFDRLGNTDRIEIASDWLNVGHVDEYVTFIPSTDACGASLVAASPTEAFAVLSQATNEELAGTGLPFSTAAELRDSLAQFKRAAATGTTGFDAYDPELPGRSGNSLDDYVRNNLRWERTIRGSVKKLVDSSSCLRDVAWVPQMFSKKDGNPTGPKASATVGGVTNMLVLRDHLIIPDQKAHGAAAVVEPLRAAVRRVLAPRVRGESKLHFIDTSVYHMRGGAIHCGTNVLREIDLNTIVR